jgi:hypothetical protein
MGLVCNAPEGMPLGQAQGGDRLSSDQRFLIMASLKTKTLLQNMNLLMKWFMNIDLFVLVN